MSAGEWEMHSFGAKIAKNSAKWRESTRFGAKKCGNSAGERENNHFGVKQGRNSAGNPEGEGKEPDQAGDDNKVGRG